MEICAYAHAPAITHSTISFIIELEEHMHMTGFLRRQFKYSYIICFASVIIFTVCMHFLNRAIVYCSKIEMYPFLCSKCSSWNDQQQLGLLFVQWVCILNYAKIMHGCTVGSTVLMHPYSKTTNSTACTRRSGTKASSRSFAQKRRSDGESAGWLLFFSRVSLFLLHFLRGFPHARVTETGSGVV